VTYEEKRRGEPRTETQIIWLRESATTFAAQCDACHHDRAWPPAVIRGALLAEADVGFATCWRGHRVRVRRFARVHAQAVRSQPA
jgi:hypothetical protein